MTANGKTKDAVGIREQVIDERYTWLTDLLSGEFVMLGNHLIGSVTVTPEAAKVVVEQHNSHNRKPNIPNLKKLVKSMRDLQFLLNGETVVFDSCRELRNGAHRMRACIESGLSFETFVIAGLPPHVFATYDQHSKRQLSQVLDINHEANSSILAASVSFIISFFDNGKIRRAGPYVTMDRPGEMAIIAEHPRLRESAEAVRRFGAKVAKRFGGKGLFCALHYLFLRVDPSLAESYLSMLADGVVTDEKLTTVRKAAAFLFQNQADGCKATLEEIAAYVIKGWNAFCTGKQLPRVDYKPNEPFPHVFGWTYEDGSPASCEEHKE